MDNCSFVYFPELDFDVLNPVDAFVRLGFRLFDTVGFAHEIGYSPAGETLRVPVGHRFLCFGRTTVMLGDGMLS